MQYSRPKGTFDIIPTPLKDSDAWKASHLWDYVTRMCKEVCYLYGFSEITTPIFESTSLFTRAAGKTSDVASKEMYQFLDKGGRDVSLRPEGTASVVRAFIENGMHQAGSAHKLFYIGPFFRYDRPQAGRYRQFHQFGGESIGKASVEKDFETIMMLYTLYLRLGLSDLHIQINTLGDSSARSRYISELELFLTPHLSGLSSDSQRRLKENPLRILDTKDSKEIELLKKAPSILDYISEDSRSHFETLVGYLKMQQVPVSVNPRLVRGLDYYNETVFEITSGSLGAQNSIGGGGRYDCLMKQCGGPDLPAVGFATGIERIILTMLAQKVDLPEKRAPLFHIVSTEAAATPILTVCLQRLRALGLSGDMTIAKKIGKGLSSASASGARFAIVIGSNEWENKVFQFKCMTSGNVENHPIETIETVLTTHRG